jgi:hypothetical protein
LDQTTSMWTGTVTDTDDGDLQTQNQAANANSVANTLDQYARDDDGA